MLPVPSDRSIEGGEGGLLCGRCRQARDEGRPEELPEGVEHYVVQEDQKARRLVEQAERNRQAAVQMAGLLAARRLAPEEDEQSFPPAQPSPLQAPASPRIGSPAKRHLPDRDETPTDVSDSGTENAIQYDAHVWAFDKLFTRFQGPDPPPPGPMSRNLWLTVETPRTSPWDQLRAAKVRKAQVDDDANMQPDLKKHNDGRRPRGARPEEEE